MEEYFCSDGNIGFSLHIFFFYILYFKLAYSNNKYCLFFTANRLLLYIIIIEIVLTQSDKRIDRVQHYYWLLSKISSECL